MIFFFIMPSLFGASGNLLLPLLLGTPEVIYPRANNISLIFLLLSWCIILTALGTEFNGGTGWTLYPPLSTNASSLSATIISLIIISLFINGLSSILSSINFILTTMYPDNILFLYSLIFTALMLIFTLPILTGGLIMIIMDLIFSTLFFDPTLSGDPIFYQHLFWFFGHPEVYVLILPAFGLTSMAIESYTTRILFGNNTMTIALGCITYIGCVVWGHHIYIIGLEGDTRAYFSILTMLISIPTGTKLYNWITTYLGTNVFNNIFIYLILTFLFIFMSGGITGILLANTALDLILHDSYLVIAHFHFVLGISALLAYLLLLAYYGPLNGLDPKTNLFISGFKSNCIKIIFIIIIWITFIPLHYLGYNGLVRRILCYNEGFIGWSILSSMSLISLILITILALVSS